MITTRFGTAVTILGNCGKHALPIGRTGTVLVVELVDSTAPHLTWTDYRLLETLKATAGLPEIMDAVTKAPQVSLEGKDLKNAIERCL